MIAPLVYRYLAVMGCPQGETFIAVPVGHRTRQWNRQREKRQVVSSGVHGSWAASFGTGRPARRAR